MASVLARRNLAALTLSHVRWNPRYFNNSAVVYKKKNSQNVKSLFEDEPTQKQAAQNNAESEFRKSMVQAKAASQRLEAAQASKRSKLSPEARHERYNKLLDFVKPRLGRKPEIKLPQVRNSAWTNLVDLATTEDQLRELAQLFPAWSALGRTFDSHFSELFIRRCEQLSCPLLALDVFGNYAKYNLKLTLPGARQLLHSLHVEHSIDKVIAASALYSHNSKDSLQVARALVPHLERMMGETKPSSENSTPPAKNVDRPQAWLQWTLKRIDKALAVENKSRAEWLRDWRLRNGHILEPSRF
ncbi:hypothetical protein F5887DRAFT_1009452 [Amanita rubescens]|nr:hypothetical protein F5887DRAFT_1009452 [Amanita rubescens]